MDVEVSEEDMRKAFDKVAPAAAAPAAADYERVPHPFPSALQLDVDKKGFISTNDIRLPHAASDLL